MSTLRLTGGMLALAALAAVSVPMPAAEPAVPGRAQEPPRHVAPPIDGKLTATVGKSLIIDSPLKIEKISVANGELVEAVAINPKEVLINGKAPGETSLIVWQEGGTRLVYDLLVRMSPLKLEAVRAQIARDFPDDDISVTYDNDTAFVRGTVKDVASADRVLGIADTLGKTVNLLRVKVPAEEPQILLKVRFADVDRSTSTSLGMQIASGAFNQSTELGTGQYSGIGVDNTGAFTLTNALNVFLFRKDLNLGVAIEALEAKNLLEILAEPNLLTINGQKASFLSGGQFPVPVVQGSASIGTVTITYKEYGIKLNFLPVVTPRGTIRLQVEPEVSSLDYTNAVTLSGFTIPALSTRTREDRGGTGRRAELRDRRADRQQFHRIAEQDPGPVQYSAAWQAVPERVANQVGRGVAGIGDARPSCGRFRRARRCPTWSGRNPSCRRASLSKPPTSRVSTRPARCRCIRRRTRFRMSNW